MLLSAVTCVSAAAAEVVKGSGDERDYRAFELGNGLEVVVVSDPGTDKAAAALDVYVGSGSDPEGRAGLAHFLEHMLFLGTQKYPEAGAYQSFISAHGGSHNAYTAFEHTNYFFDVEAGHLEGALDRFAQFFIAPLFNPEYVEREREVVHSEFVSKKKSDGRRVHSAFKRALNSAHPMSRFSVGNRETLGGEVRDELIAFYERHYSADIMALVVLGREGLDELERMVRERFAAVPDRDASPLAIEVPLFAPGSLPARLDVVPVKARRTLTLTFPLPPVLGDYATKPTSYVSELVGNETEGSLLSLLEARGWASGLSARTAASRRDHALFEVEVRLTPAGLEHTDTITGLVFRYLEMVRERGVTRRVFDEQRRLSEIAFRFQERGDARDYVRVLAERLQRYPEADVLRGPAVADDYRPERIREVLARLTPENVLVTVSAPERETDARTPWFQVPYRLRALRAEQVAGWVSEAAPAELELPGPNPFVPENLALKPVRGDAAAPLLARERKAFELWFKQDDTFGVPRADFYFSVRSKRANDTAAHDVLTHLYMAMVNDQLEETGYQAGLAGLDYELYKHVRGFTARISGYDDKLGLLLARIVRALREPELSAERFALWKAELAERLRARAHDSAHVRAQAEVPRMLLTPFWTEQQRLAALRELTLADLRAFVPRLLGRVHVVAMAHGNLHRDEALSLGREVEAAFAGPARAADVPNARVVALRRGDELVRRIRSRHSESALVMYFQGEDKSHAARARALLTAQIAQAPLFHELRTERHLGYVVRSGVMPLLDVPAFGVTVQSPHTDPDALSDAVDAALRELGRHIDGMSGAEFERHKAALVSRLTAGDGRMRARSDRYWDEIDRRNHRFDTRERLARVVRALDLQSFRDYYWRVLFGDRRCLMVQAFGRNHSSVEPGEARLVRNPSAFKLRQPHYTWLQASPVPTRRARGG